MNIAAAGEHYSGNRRADDYLKMFLNCNRKLQAGSFSTLAVSNILENAANKVLLSAFDAQETVWNEVCAIRNLNDFKQHSWYRLNTKGGYAKVGSDGELKHGTFDDSKLTLQGDTYGMILALSRRDMINDDLSAFEQIPSQLGRLAALALEYAVIELITANANSFFAAGNNNLKTGAGSDLTISGLTASAQAFRDQVDSSGNPILVSPDRILVGSQDAVQAGQLHNDVDVREGRSGTSTKKEFTRNPHVGAFRPIVSPILNNTNVTQMDGSAFTTQNANHWYMFGNPNVLAAFNVGFLNGNRTPVIESAETDFNTLGMQWRSYHDWGVGEGDSEGAVKNDGA